SFSYKLNKVNNISLSDASKAYVECSYSGCKNISPTVTPFTHSKSNTFSLSCIKEANLSIPYVNSTATGFASNPPICWKYVNWVISIPSSHTSQPSPAAPRVGFSQLSSTKRISWISGSIPNSTSESRYNCWILLGDGFMTT